MERFLFENPVIAISLYLISTIADYYLTIFGARYYKSKKQKVIYETGYELNPKYQSDVNKLSLWSPTFFRTHALVLILLIGAFWLNGEYYLAMFVYGLFLIPTLHVNVRHLSIIWLYRYQDSTRRNGTLGKLKIKSWLSYRQAAYHSFFEGAVLFLIVFVLTGSPVFLGGAVGELSGTRWFVRLSNNALKTKKELRRKAAQKKHEKPKRPSAANLLLFAILALVLFQLLRIAFLIQYSLYSIALEPIPQKIIGLISAILAIFTGLWLIRAIGRNQSFSLIAVRRFIPIFLGLSWLAVFTVPAVYYSLCLSTVLVITLVIMIWGFIAFEGPSAKKYYKLNG